MIYEFEIHGHYGAWEMVTCEETRKEALRTLRTYRENEPDTAFRVVRVKSTEEIKP